MPLGQILVLTVAPFPKGLLVKICIVPSFWIQLGCQGALHRDDDDDDDDYDINRILFYSMVYIWAQSLLEELL